MKSNVSADYEERHYLLEAILENAAHAIISTTIDGVITSFNRAAEEMLGYRAEELVGKHNPGVFHLAEQVVQRSIEFSEKLKIKVAPGFTTFVCHNDLGLDNQFEWIYVRKDGSHLPVLLSVTALKDAKGVKTGYLGIAQDIYQLKDTEKKLKRSNDELAKFAYRTSHDLKAPLSSIRGLVGFIEEDLKSKDFDEVEQNLQKIAKQASKLESLVVDILKLAKSDLADQPFEFINLADFFEDIRQSYELILNEKRIVFSFQALGCINVKTQKTRLKQIVGNLVMNSINYSDPSKKRCTLKFQLKLKMTLVLLLQIMALVYLISIKIDSLICLLGFIQIKLKEAA